MKYRIVVAMALSALAVQRTAAQDEHEGPEFQLKRQAWFNDQRAYPAREVDWEAMVRTRQQFASAYLSRGLGILASHVAGGGWIPMGPGGFFGQGYWDSGPQLDAGRIDAIAIHPTAPRTLLVASPNGGVWSSTNTGVNWNPLFDAQCSMQVSKVRYDPVNPNIVYAAAAQASGAANCALFRSLDGGSTWASFNGGLGFAAYAGGNIRELYVDPASAGTPNAVMLFSFGSSGLYRSTTAGNSWSRPATLTFGAIHSIVGLPGKPGVLFAGVADVASNPSPNSGVYRSSDNGATWTKVYSGSGYGTVGRFELAVSPAQPNSVWILAGDRTSTFNSIARWDDDASVGTVLAASGIDFGSGRTRFGTQATYDLVVTVDPTDATRIFIAGIRAFRSTDGGASFSPMATDIHCDWHTLVIDPRNPRLMYAGTDGGVYMTVDGGGTWTSRNAGLVISMYYPGIAQHPTDPNVVIGGLQDNGTIVSNGTPWYNSVFGGDGGYAAINFASPGTVWATCQWSGGPCITKHVQTSTGFSSPNVTGGIITSDRAQFIAPLVMDPVTPTTLYFATMRLYRTINDGGVWAPISPDLSKGSGSISTVGIAASDVQTIYAGTSDGNVQVTRNGGTTWTVATAGLPNRFVTRIAVDRTTPTRAILSMSGSGSSHVFLTTDAGATWTSIGGNLPDMPVSAVVMIDDGPNHFLAGSDVGVFETLDGGLTWSNTPGGLPNVIVHDLSYNPATKQLVAATYGRGLFRYSLASSTAVLRGDVNRDGSVNAADALLIQQALVGLAMPAGLTILPHGDANCDGKVDAADVLIVLRAAVGLTTAGSCVGTNR